MPENTWTLSEQGATTKVGPWLVSIQPTQPQRGVRITVPADELTDSQAPGHEWLALTVQPLPNHSLEAEEAYVRQTDLIVRFDQTEQDSFAFQLNYRLLNAPRQLAMSDSAGVLGLEMWVSVQTDDLDSEPVLMVASQTPDGQPWTICDQQQVLGADSTALESGLPRSQGPAALQAVAAGQTCLWLIEPTDQRHAHLRSQASDAEQRIELFGHFMEKGVIRRARMRMYLLDQEITLEQVRELYLEFANSPLPLTA